MANQAWQNFQQNGGASSQSYAQPTSQPRNWQEFQSGFNTQPTTTKVAPQSNIKNKVVSAAKGFNQLTDPIFSITRGVEKQVTDFAKSVPGYVKAAAKNPVQTVGGVGQAVVFDFGGSVANAVEKGVAKAIGVKVPERWDISLQQKAFKEWGKMNLEAQGVDKVKAFQTGEFLGAFIPYALASEVVTLSVGSKFLTPAATRFAPKALKLVPKINNVIGFLGVGQLEYDKETDGARVDKLKHDAIMLGLFEGGGILAKGLSKATSKVVSKSYNQVAGKFKSGKSVKLEEIEKPIAEAKAAIQKDTGKPAEVTLAKNIANASEKDLTASAQKITTKEISVEKLSSSLENSLEKNKNGIKPGGIEIAKKEIQSGNIPPIKVRLTDEGKLFLEDGRHHLQAAKELGIKTYPVEDVTGSYNKAKTNAAIKQLTTPLSGTKTTPLPSPTEAKPKVPDISKKIKREQIQNLKDAAGIKRMLKQARTEVEAANQAASSAKEVRKVFDPGEAKRISKYRDAYWGSDKLQIGDLETMRKKYGDDFSHTLENIIEKNPTIKSEVEAFEFLKEFPKASYVDKDLIARQKQLSQYFDTLRKKQDQLKIKADDALNKEWDMALAQQEQLAKVVKVPRSQLPVGEGKEKISRLEARITQYLQDAPDDVKNLSTYNQMVKKEQIAKAAAYVLKNPDEALEVAFGTKEPPAGLLRNSVFTALYNQAGDDAMLATKIATQAATRGGQEISILSELDPNSPVRYMSEIVRVREQQAMSRYGGKSIKEVTDKIIKQVKVKAPDRNDWGKFLETIKC